MSSMTPNRLTRVQVQEKIKRNFQALCARCPQLGNTHETLDDSLTSLQWLSNLNVNISNPAEQSGKNGTPPRNGTHLPPFPSKFINGLDSNAVTACQEAPPSTCSPVRLEFGNNKGQNLQITKPTFSKAGSQIMSGASRALARNGRKTSAHVLGRPNPLAQENVLDRTYSFSAGPLKMHRRGSSNPAQNLPRSNAGFPRKSETSNVVDSYSETNMSVFERNEVSMTNTDSSQTSPLPQIEHLNIELPENNESLSEASSGRHYSFSPREATLDLLPGQVDYKNNPYVKPAFSFTTLICMALQNNKRHRMTFPAICKWITDNFMYYRYADSGWQEFVKLNLTQSKYFDKVHKKKDAASKTCLWEINRNCNVKLREVTSPVLSGTPTRNSPRLGALPNQISPASSIALTNLQSLMKIDPEDSLGMAGRKRKQVSPQKVVRRRGTTAKKRRNTKSAGHRNLLQEQAPELGSLKGDFNWNSVFDEFFGTPEGELSVTPTSLPSLPSTNEGLDHRDIMGQFSDDVVSGSLLAHDMLILPDVPESAINDENHMGTSTFQKSTNPQNSWPSPVNSHSTAKSDRIEKPKSGTSSPKLPLIHPCDLDEFTAGAEKEDLDSLNSFLEDVGELDLTVTGRQIEPPADWMPVCAELDAILCEKQNNRLLGNVSSSSNEIEDIILASCQSITEHSISPRSNSSKGRRSRKCDHTSGSNNSSPREITSSRLPGPRRP